MLKDTQKHDIYHKKDILVLFIFNRPLVFLTKRTSANYTKTN